MCPLGIELAEIFRQHGPAYRNRFKGRIPASHLKTMQAIEQYRTKALGGHLYTCEQCGEIRYRYHSCKNRHYPKCHLRPGRAAVVSSPNRTPPNGHFHPAPRSTRPGPQPPTKCNLSCWPEALASRLRPVFFKEKNISQRKIIFFQRNHAFQPKKINFFPKIIIFLPKKLSSSAKATGRLENWKIGSFSS